LGLTLPWFFFCLSNPQVSQRLFVPASLSGMRKMLTGFLIFGFIYTLISVLWGLSTRVMLPNLPKADMATPALLGSPAVPAVLALIAMAGITAAAISTIDSILLTLSSMFARDVYRNLKPDVPEAQQVQFGKWIIPIISILAMLFAFLKLDLIATLSVASSAGLLVMVPAIFGAFFWKRGTAAGAAASMVAGGVLVAALQFGNLKPLGVWPGVWGIIITTLVFLVVSLVTAPPKGGAAYVDRINAALQEKNAV
ncbi:MAG: sodium:solute symporter family protein, partial [Clostridia bacterium]|nr:sodium:solute symporter family protein [Clostridia bacterium]